MKLLCIDTHPEKLVLSGECYESTGNKPPCNCRVVDIGIRTAISEPVTICSDCGCAYPSDGIVWIFRKRFIPIADIVRQETIATQTSVLEETTAGYRLLSFGELGFSMRTYPDTKRQKAFLDFGIKCSHTTTHFYGETHYE